MEIVKQRQNSFVGRTVCISWSMLVTAKSWERWMTLKLRIKQKIRLCNSIQHQATFLRHFTLNRLTPNDPYMGRTAPLTSKRCILYIYSTNIGTEYFKHALYSPFFSSKCSLFHNAKLFGSCIIHILYTGCSKIKKNNSGAKGLNSSNWQAGALQNQKLQHSHCGIQVFLELLYTPPITIHVSQNLSYNYLPHLITLSKDSFQTPPPYPLGLQIHLNSCPSTLATCF